MMLTKEEQDVLEGEALREIWGLRYFPVYKKVGSCYINGEGRDLDMLLYEPRYYLIMDLLKEQGWKQDIGNEYDDMPTLSMKKGVINLLFAVTPEDFDKFSAAADVCKLISKGDLSKPYRVAIHEIILNGQNIEDAIAKGLKHDLNIPFPEADIGQAVHPVAENQLRAAVPPLDWQIIVDELQPQNFNNIVWRAA